MNKVKYWEILNNLDIVSITFSSPRPGTDFVHSLLDAHPEIITFDGWLLFHNFYNEATSIFGTKKFLTGKTTNNNSRKRSGIISKDFFYEFAWGHLHKFDSRYDDLENKGNLGAEGKDYNYIDIDEFVNIACHLMDGKNFSSRNAFLATYAAYTLAKGDNLIGKKILLHHIHNQEYIPIVKNDFPDLKIINCVRDPRIYATKIKKYQELLPLSKLSIGSSFSIYKIMIEGSRSLMKLNTQKIRTNVLEDLHKDPEKIMKSICDWMDIKFDSILLKSTWNKKEWGGDSLSEDLSSTFSTDRYKKSQREWKEDLSIVDKILVENLMSEELNHYGYRAQYTSHIYMLVIPFLILIPAKYEYRIFLDVIDSGQYKLLYPLAKIIIHRYKVSFTKLKNKLFNKEKLFTTFTFDA